MKGVQNHSRSGPIRPIYTVLKPKKKPKKAHHVQRPNEIWVLRAFPYHIFPYISGKDQVKWRCFLIFSGFSPIFIYFHTKFLKFEKSTGFPIFSPMIFPIFPQFFVGFSPSVALGFPSPSTVASSYRGHRLEDESESTPQPTGDKNHWKMGYIYILYQYHWNKWNIHTIKNGILY